MTWQFVLAGLAVGVLVGNAVAMLAAHIFELGSTWFNYYYVDENCSYHILAALEVAAPRLRAIRSACRPMRPPPDR